MGWFSKSKDKAPTPEEVPNEQLTDLSRQYISWKSSLIFAVGVILVLTFIHTIMSNPTISGFTTVDNTEEASRFTGMLSILVVIFAFFALLLFLWKKKVKH